ncbi:P63C domain-containing protein, partial [Chloroflexota bacterium]
MNTAQNVIAKFGGQTKLAKFIGKGQSTVQHWAKKGIIPAKWQRELLLLAQAHNIDLTPSDFVSTREITVSETPQTPIARWQGILGIGNEELPCYVLDDGRRVISRTGATSLLTERKGGGNLEQYIRIQVLQPYLTPGIDERMIKFIIPGVVNKTVRGLTADDFLDICKAYVRARDVGVLKSDSQISIAVQSSMFLSACSKVGLIALIDEATGYQYEREEDALQVKLRLYLQEEMREWEKTFPDELWMEFGRLTHWEGSIKSRPKYWGKLVLELIYEYLDPDVIDWLRQNKAPVR